MLGDARRRFVQTSFPMPPGYIGAFRRGRRGELSLGFPVRELTRTHQLSRRSPTAASWQHRAALFSSTS